LGEDYQKKIKELKEALLAYLGTNGRYYGQLTRIEQSVEDLAQALNTRLDQLLLDIENGCPGAPAIAQSPSERLASRFIEAGIQLSQAKGARLDNETVDQFEESLDLLDMASDYRRKAATAQGQAESLAIKSKRNQGS